MQTQVLTSSKLPAALARPSSARSAPRRVLASPVRAGQRCWTPGYGHPNYWQAANWQSCRPNYGGRVYRDEAAYSQIEEDLRRLAKAWWGMYSGCAPQAERAERGRPISIDYKETDTHLEITAELPGVAPKDISIEVSPERVLTISTKDAAKKKERSEDAGYVRVERSSRAFFRRLRLPDTVDVDAIKARAANGVLTITLPKFAQPIFTSKQVRVDFEDVAAAATEAPESTAAASQATPEAGAEPAEQQVQVQQQEEPQGKQKDGPTAQNY